MARLRKSWLLLCALPLLACAFLHAQQQQSEATLILSSQIKEQLSDLKTQRLLLEKSIQELSDELTLSEGRRLQLETELSDLNSSSLSMIGKLETYSKRLTDYEIQLRARARWIAVLLTILTVRTACMAAGFVLYARGVRLPRWLDIIL